MGTKNLSWYSQSRMWEVETFTSGLMQIQKAGFSAGLRIEQAR